MVIDGRSLRIELDRAFVISDGLVEFALRPPGVSSVLDRQDRVRGDPDRFVVVGDGAVDVPLQKPDVAAIEVRVCVIRGKAESLLQVRHSPIRVLLVVPRGSAVVVSHAEIVSVPSALLDPSRASGDALIQSEAHEVLGMDACLDLHPGLCRRGKRRQAGRGRDTDDGTEKPIGKHVASAKDWSLAACAPSSKNEIHQTATTTVPVQSSGAMVVRGS